MKTLIKSVARLALVSAIATPAFAATTSDSALSALKASVSNAEQVIAQVQAQEAINRLSASVAEAELTLAVAFADDAIREVRGQEALNSLAASVAGADLAIALADSVEVINSVSDAQMLAELDAILPQVSENDASDLIVAVVGERPVLASAIEDSAMQAGYDSNLVAGAILSGLNSAEATAAGK